MNEKLSALRECIERGKATKNAPYPPDMKGRPGAVEWTAELLADGVEAVTILDEALIAGLREVGRKFQCNEAYVPDMLISADAMKKSMALLREVLVRENVEPRGTFIIGTVKGDLHDIGKNLVAMMVEGAGWDVIDLGVDVTPEKFLATLEVYPKAVVGLSALLTTTMQAMKTTIETLHARFPQAAVVVGGAPVTEQFAREIAATGYAADPQGAIDLLEQLCVA
jgi:5-methyltetrahydrofolate--homocysteine methyltransferase